MSEPRGSSSNSRLRYAVDETPSEALTLGLSLQVTTLVLTGIIRRGGSPDHELVRRVGSSTVNS